MVQDLNHEEILPRLSLTWEDEVGNVVHFSTTLLDSTIWEVQEALVRGLLACGYPPSVVDKILVHDENEL